MEERPMIDTLTPLTIYLILQADTFKAVMMTITTITSVALFIMVARALIHSGMDEDSSYHKTATNAKAGAMKLAMIAVPGWIITAIIPSTTTLAMVIGIPMVLEVGYEAAQSEATQQAIAALNHLLEQTIGEIKEIGQ